MDEKPDMSAMAGGENLALIHQIISGTMSDMRIFMFAIPIASIGLNVNSNAVIIGKNATSETPSAILSVAGLQQIMQI